MPKRLRKGMCYQKSGGYKITCGKRMLANGETVYEQFLLGHDLEVAQTKAAIIRAENLKLKQRGSSVWTEEAYRNLHGQEAITNEKAEAVLKTFQAIKLYEDQPLTQTELARFADPVTGRIKPEHALAAAELDAQKVFARDEIRSRFHQKLLLQADTDPIGTLERITKLFGWNSEKTQQLLFNVQGSMAVTPIAVDASESHQPLIEQQVQQREQQVQQQVQQGTGESAASTASTDCDSQS